ncbi:PF05960 family protein [Leptospira weilii str. 2006001853]|uniref:PF05960 family protein n=3 Tax=Leptospira weilii TaxID=28184 RepID=A0A828YY31_9LEPT|nr:PF05960 family protein [Leptospira weilii str. 2006001853]EMM72989.1 PF05960 family protein [Leptospira weilii str. 2006001855]EMN45903.1 PF05960 family protein [Leptospira weilii str. LNT 1234]
MFYKNKINFHFPGLFLFCFTMSKFSLFKRILFGTLVLVLTLFLHTIFFKPLTLGLFYEKIFWESVLNDPEYLTSLGILNNFGIGGYQKELTDISVERQKQDMEKAKKNLEILLSYGKEDLSGQELISFEILEWSFGLKISGEKFLFHDYPANQLFGVQSQLPTFLATQHPIKSSQDVENYIARLEVVPKKIDQLIEGILYRDRKGILPPDFILDRLISEVEGFIKVPAKENILYTAFGEKIEKINSISSDLKDQSLARVQQSIESGVYPSYSKLLNLFLEQRKRADSKAGVWKLPDGDAYYSHELKKHTTTELNPEQIHNIGLSEVSRIQNEMKTILKNLGKNQSIPNAMSELRKDSRFLFPDNEKGKLQALEEYKKILKDSEEKAKFLFFKMPESKVEVDRIPVFKEKTAPGAYYDEPALDGSRPGIFYANLRDTKEIPKFGMKTLTYHETVPGHHLQIAIMQELKGLPRFRNTTTFTAYVEGWALYAERLAKDYDFFQDPYSDLGRLQAELFRAVRLVVDTGLHYKRWTREQAISYMTQNTGMAPKDVTAEIERYIVYPGQACSYKIGMLKILELREKVKIHKKKTFDIREFHSAVLDSGSLPLIILERLVEEKLLNEKTIL